MTDVNEDKDYTEAELLALNDTSIIAKHWDIKENPENWSPADDLP